MTQPPRTAIIIGAGSGLSASLARLFHANGVRLMLAARDTEKLGPLAAATSAHVQACDAGDPGQVERLFAAADAALGPPDVVVYNASRRARGAIAELDPSEVEAAIRTTAFGAFLAGREAARRMLPRAAGTILFTGASAGVKGFPLSAPFAMGKFALRGLAQSMARELHPKGVHVAHIVVDGGIRGPRHPEAANAPDSTLDPDAIAEAYWGLIMQPRSAWAWEIALRPWVEKF